MSVRVIPVGNVTAKTELTYEYGVRKKAKESADSSESSAAMAVAKPEVEYTPPLQIEGKPHLPFQLQVEYTSKDGSRLMRVITDAKPITRDRGVAEKGTSWFVTMKTDTVIWLLLKIIHGLLKQRKLNT